MRLIGVRQQLHVFCEWKQILEHSQGSTSCQYPIEVWLLCSYLSLTLRPTKYTTGCHSQILIDIYSISGHSNAADGD